jgi:hypothetical protein
MKWDLLHKPYMEWTLVDGLLASAATLLILVVGCGIFQAIDHLGRWFERRRKDDRDV